MKVVKKCLSYQFPIVKETHQGIFKLWFEGLEKPYKCNTIIRSHGNFYLCSALKYLTGWKFLFVSKISIKGFFPCSVKDGKDGKSMWMWVFLLPQSYVMAWNTPPWISFCVVTELYKTVLASVPTGKMDVSSIFFLYRKALINWWEQVCWSVLAGVVFLSKGHEKYPQTHHSSVWRADRLVTLEISL